jgi:hypothetical protein
VAARYEEKCPRDFGESLGRPRREQGPPLGRLQDNSRPRLCGRGHRLGARICLRKGCGRTYQPRHWKQRYCQEPECLKEVRRWQAVKRQQRRRERPEVRQQRAAAERERRARQRKQRRCDDSVTADRFGDDPRDADGPWSRMRRNSAPFCERVGCYEGLRSCSGGQARYCGDDCRRATTRVRDRQRKWLARKTPAGRFKRHLEYQSRRAARAAPHGQTADSRRRNLAIDCEETVVDYRDLAEPRLPCRDGKMVSGDDRETHPDRRSHPPPPS